jgi:hypothetical protein
MAVVICCKPGQLANRLFFFSHFIANAIENQYPLLNPGFDEYCPYFSATHQNNFGPYSISVGFRSLLPVAAHLLPRAKRYLPALYHRLCLECGDAGMDLNNADYLTRAQKNRLLIIADGWLFRDRKNFVKHADTIRQFFQPVFPYAENTRSLIDQCRQTCDVLVGVHIRRGDYKEWNGGCYFYDNTVYLDKMRQLHALFQATGKRAGFLICSNEPLAPDAFAPLPAYTGTRHFMEDLYALSLCDYIIAPPSTFSLWASFHGQTPYLYIMKPDQTISLEQFSIHREG